MPELPEVETMVRGIRDRVEGRTVTDVRQCPTHCKPITITPRFSTLARRLRGRIVTTVRRLAKRVVFEFDDRSHLAIEPRMTGLMLLADPPDVEHLRVEWCLDKSGVESSVWFWDRRGLGTIRHYLPGELERLLGPTVLGPDALTATVADWLRICRGTRRAVKVLMLDQKRMAGIGNLYASEILHRAGVSPLALAAELSDQQIADIQAATQAILETAIRYEGSTLADGTYRNALNQNGGYQNAHEVYAREGEACRRCTRGVIERIVQAQRSTFFCGNCQSPDGRTRRPRR